MTHTCIHTCIHTCMQRCAPPPITLLWSVPPCSQVHLCPQAGRPPHTCPRARGGCAQQGSWQLQVRRQGGASTGHHTCTVARSLEYLLNLNICICISVIYVSVYLYICYICICISVSVYPAPPHPHPSAWPLTCRAACLAHPQVCC